MTIYIPRIFHFPTQTIQFVSKIDFNNNRVDTYGIDQPIYDIPDNERSDIMLSTGMLGRCKITGEMIPIYDADFIQYDLTYIGGNKGVALIEFFNDVTIHPYIGFGLCTPSKYETAESELLGPIILGNAYENPELFDKHGIPGKNHFNRGKRDE